MPDHMSVSTQDSPIILASEIGDTLKRDTPMRKVLSEGFAHEGHDLCDHSVLIK